MTGLGTAIPRRARAAFSQSDADRLGVALHSAQKALEDMAAQCDAPDWMRSLPSQIASPISSTLHALAVALHDDVDEESRSTAVRATQVLRGDIYEALTQTKAGEVPISADVVLAALTVLGAGVIVGQPVTQAIVWPRRYPLQPAQSPHSPLLRPT